MKITVITEPFHYVKIEGLYSKSERKDMLDEMVLLERANCFLQPKDTGQTKENMKKNSGLFLDEVYSNRSCSHILKNNGRLFDVFKTEEVKKSWLFKDPPDMMSYTTLISYYENSDYYKPHHDSTQFTVLSWFYKTPKKFKGGDFEFTDYDITHKVDNETIIMFPSGIKHAATITVMDSIDEGKQLGRFCMAQFILPQENR